MKIICIGRNYAAHAKELKNEVPEAPVFFLKPDTALLPVQRKFYMPAFSNEIRYEAELVIRISREGKNIEEKFASRYYSEVTVGIDFTAADLQEIQKSKGLPWEIAKAFDHSAPVGKFSTADFSKPLLFSLRKNGMTVQQGNSEQMLFGFNRLISYVSKFITLRKGDLLFTGTPQGVGPVAQGDVLECFLGEEKVLKVDIA